MSDREQLAAVAAQFRASGLLGKPGPLSRLFDFLLARTLAGDAPKEIEIALEVFGKGPAFDVSQDAVVRVYVHKLRRRLDDYHAKAETAAAGRLLIPKGEYRLVLDRTSVETSHADAGREGAASSSSRRWLLPLLGVIVGLICGGTLALFAQRFDGDADLRTLRANSVWAPLLADDVPITIVVGDYYMLGETDSEGNVRRLVREFFINSHSDFLDHAELDPQLMQRYRNLNLTYLPTSSAFALQDIAPILEHNKRVRVTLMSSLDVNLLKTTHVVYIGFISGLGMLGDSVFAASRVSPGGSFDELIDSKTNATYVSTAMPMQGSDSSYRDYGYFSSFVGPAGHRVLVIAGTRDTGLRQMGEILSQPQSLDQLQSYASKGEPFESLYEVYGVAQASMKAKQLFVGPMRNIDMWDVR